MNVSGTIDTEGMNGKRESILGMAVSGVRNLLVVSSLVPDGNLRRFIQSIYSLKVDEMSRSKSMRIFKSYREVIV